MKFLIQRVSLAAVFVEEEIVGEIKEGFLVYIGICDEDTPEIADKMLKKMLGLRIFKDEEEKVNLSLADVNGELLLISQFTLYADCRKGNRPSFVQAGNPQHAKELYDYIVEKAAEAGFRVQQGVFGADMKVSSINEGPFTIMLDSTHTIR